MQPGGIARGGQTKTPRRSASGLSPSRIPMAANTATSGSVAGGNGNGTQQKGVEERLRILLSLLESSKEDAKNGREDTLQYLSQLESVARRLKDQLLNDNISNDSKVRSKGQLISKCLFGVTKSTQNPTNFL